MIVDFMTSSEWSRSLESVITARSIGMKRKSDANNVLNGMR